MVCPSHVLANIGQSKCDRVRLWDTNWAFPAKTHLYGTAAKFNLDASCYTYASKIGDKETTTFRQDASLKCLKLPSNHVPHLTAGKISIAPDASSAVLGWDGFTKIERLIGATVHHDDDHFEASHNQTIKYTVYDNPACKW